MTTKYYLKGATLGLLCAAGVAYSLLGKVFFEMLTVVDSTYEKFNGLVPVASGVGAVLVMAFIYDRRSHSTKYFFKGLLNPLLIFLMGSFAGSFVNFLCNGLSDSTGFNDYFFKTFYWLSVVGCPGTILVGGLWFLVFKALVRKRAEL